MNNIYLAVCYIVFLCSVIGRIQGKNRSYYFASSYCNEETRLVKAGKLYILLWNGQQNHQNLCSFNFRGDFDSSVAYDICFESVVFNLLPINFKDVKLTITNRTKSSWIYDHHNRRIPRTCVRNAYQLNVSIHLPIGYTAPDPKPYIKIKLTALEVTVQVSESSSMTLHLLHAVTIVVIVLAIYSIWMLKKKGKCPTCLDDKIRCFSKACSDVTSCLFKCQCLRSLDSPLFVCDSCSAWTGSCPNALQVIDDRQHTEINTVLCNSWQNDNSSNTPSTTENIEWPPPYHSLHDTLTINDTTALPPSYEDVIGQKVLSAQ